MRIKLTVDVDDYTVNQIKEEVEYVTERKVDAKKVAIAFIKDLIDRYFSVEYLDAEDLADQLEE